MMKHTNIILCFFAILLLTYSRAAFSEEDEDFNKQLMDVENEVNDLKERFFKSKATLRLLKESIVQGAVQDARAKIWIRNNLGDSYKIEGSIQCTIDNVDFPTSTEGNISSQKEYSIIDKEISPGKHFVEIKVNLRGNGRGLFSYINNYSFTVKRKGMFTAEQGDECQLIVNLYEKKGFAVSFLDKPQISFEVRCRPMSGIDQ